MNKFFSQETDMHQLAINAEKAAPAHAADFAARVAAELVKLLSQLAARG